MREEIIRPIAICVCRDGERILVAEYLEKGRLYYRPLGGAIEFGEHGSEAIQREFREEIAAELRDVRYLGLLENIYTVEGRARPPDRPGLRRLPNGSRTVFKGIPPGR